MEAAKYLTAHGFTVYVVSGTDRDADRVMIAEVLGIPYRQIIGSDVYTVGTDQGDSGYLEYQYSGTDVPVRTDVGIIKNVKSSKPMQMAQELGQQPVIAFGNSTGDTSMFMYTTCQNRYRSAAFCIVPDDDAREVAYPDKVETLTALCEANGWYTVSMKDDFATIYGDDVTRTDATPWLDRMLELLQADNGTDAADAADAAPDYSNPAMWAYLGTEEQGEADVFFIAPTNVLGDADYLNVDVSNADDLYAIRWAIAMQTGIYNTDARFYAPYYRQVTLACYELPEEEEAPCLAIAEQDVLNAFAWYMEHENNGRPVIIAGFSQGADMGLRLLKAYGQDEAFQSVFVAAYLIGWRVTEEDLIEYPSLKMAQGETDTGVIISFECEAESVTGSFIVPEGVFTYSINPLNWRTDSTVATKEENPGFVQPGMDGSVVTEIPQLCGCYIDPVRGTLKVTDVTPEQYPPLLTLLPEGSYHIYDYMFFYRSLQENVVNRLEAWLLENQPAEAVPAA